MNKIKENKFSAFIIEIEYTNRLPSEDYLQNLMYNIPAKKYTLVHCLLKLAVYIMGEYLL